MAEDEPDSQRGRQRRCMPVNRRRDGCGSKACGCRIGRMSGMHRGMGGMWVWQLYGCLPRHLLWRCFLLCIRLSRSDHAVPDGYAEESNR